MPPVNALELAELGDLRLQGRLRVRELGKCRSSLTFELRGLLLPAAVQLRRYLTRFVETRLFNGISLGLRDGHQRRGLGLRICDQLVRSGHSEFKHSRRGVCWGRVAVWPRLGVHEVDDSVVMRPRTIRTSGPDWLSRR